MRSEKGQSMVEFALVVPLIILLLLGMVDFGRLFHAHLTLEHAGREAARAASIGKDEATVISTAISNAASLSLAEGQVHVSGLGTSGGNVTITIKYPISFITPVISSLVGTYQLENKTIMRIE